jgi:hypothetical protein
MSSLKLEIQFLEIKHKLSGSVVAIAESPLGEPGPSFLFIPWSSCSWLRIYLI